tara:strand:+ start:24264 stop:24797 length:534 start_codon:yes stop_codon:yes gene_type:complete
MSLRSDIEQWDKKAVQPIAKAYNAHASSPSFIEDLLDMLTEPTLEVGVSWMLKHAIEADDLVGESLAPEQLTALYRDATKLTHWESKLHLLQIMEFLPIPSRAKSNAERFVRDGLDSEHKFVRAWAFSGMHALATNHPAYQAEAETLFEQAVSGENEPPSVKARVRKLIKRGFPDSN